MKVSSVDDTIEELNPVLSKPGRGPNSSSDAFLFNVYMHNKREKKRKIQEG